MGNFHRGDIQERRALDTFVKLLRAAEAVSSRAHQSLVGAGLTVSQFGVLEALYHRGPLCQTELANKLLRSNGNLTTVVNNLERRGLVERRRAQDDRRFVRVELTEAGRTLIRDLFPSHARHVTREMSALNPEELDVLGSLCRKLGREHEHEMR